ncbi:MAG: inositol monophosphatase family protein [Planctomycetota bacterium]
MEREVSRLLLAAQRVSREGGLIAKEMLSRSQVVGHKKYGEIVTEADERVEERVISSLKELYPDDGFDSEERGKENTDAEYVWILDPIDGTKYYAKGIPLYSVSLALARRGELIVGVVYSPESDQMYCASIGSGAILNDKRIHCSAEEDVAKASICLEIPSKDSPRDELHWALEKMCILIEHAHRVRIIGVGSLGLCFCARGGFDAYVNLGCMWKYCDNAAGQVIVREAGGEFSYFGKADRQIIAIAGPAALCEKIRQILRI